MINDRGMKRIVTLIMCVWVLASCQESREEAMYRLVNEWNGKEIKFPSRSVFTIQGRIRWILISVMQTIRLSRISIR